MSILLTLCLKHRKSERQKKRKTSYEVSISGGQRVEDKDKQLTLGLSECQYFVGC